jgi:GNAT superfamily N-acetyltransferase
LKAGNLATLHLQLAPWLHRLYAIDSLFVDAAYRGRGIGDMLMRRVLAWLDDIGVRTRRVCVLAALKRCSVSLSGMGFIHGCI